MQITIEPASPRNLEQLLKIERECFATEAYSKEQILSLLREPNAVGLLVNINDEVAGFTIGIVEDHGGIKVGHIYTIDVVSKHRRKGVGIKLLEEIEKVFQKKSAEISCLEVRADNQAARSLYQKAGYEELEVLQDYYSPGVHGLTLKKQLRTK